jgi:hypothetical protein
MNNDEAAAAALEQHVNPETPESAQTQEQQETPVTQETEEQTPVQPETPVAEGAEAPSAEEEVVDTTDVDWTQFLPQATNVQAPTPDENGLVDPQEYINYTINAKLAEQSNELRGWQQATKVLPEIANNPQLRDFVHNQRLASVATGGKGDLADAAKTVKDMLGIATATGKAQATTSVQIQQAAALETGGTGTAPPNDAKQAIADRINAGDPTAVQELLADWIDQGAI